MLRYWILDSLYKQQKKVRHKTEDIFKCHGNKSESNYFILISMNNSNCHTKDMINSYPEDFLQAKFRILKIIYKRHGTQPSSIKKKTQ